MEVKPLTFEIASLDENKQPMRDTATAPNLQDLRRILDTQFDAASAQQSASNSSNPLESLMRQAGQPGQRGLTSHSAPAGPFSAAHGEGSESAQLNASSTTASDSETAAAPPGFSPGAMGLLPPGAPATLSSTPAAEEVRSDDDLSPVQQF